MLVPNSNEKPAATELTGSLKLICAIGSITHCFTALVFP